MRWFQPATAIIVAFGALAAAGGYVAINDYAIAPFQREVDRVAGEFSTVIADSIDRQIKIAENAGALFAAPRANVTRWAFFDYVDALPAANPGMTTVAWIPRVSGRQRAEFEARAKADGLFDFRFVERAGGGSRTKAAQRSEYFPIYYVEPYAGNERLLGLDLAANQDVGAVMARVRDSGKTTVRAAALAGGAPGVPGLSVIVPVYQTTVAPFTVAERRASLAGFVHVAFRFDLLLRSLRAGVGGLPALDIEVYGRNEIGNPSLIQSFTARGDGSIVPAATTRADGGAMYAVNGDAAGQRWTVVVRPDRGLVQKALGFAPWTFVAFVVLMTGLLLRHVAAMRIATARAETANRAKSEFLAMMSHELRTPLNSVIGFSDMMINEVFGPLANDHYRQYTQHINRSAGHLLVLINTILDLSKVEAGFYTLDERNVSLGQIWDSVITMLEETIRDSGVEVTANLSGSPVMLHADPTVLRQILQNLVSNAVKFTANGGRVEVTAGLTPEGRFDIRVADTGIGIANENLDLVLQPFRQVDTSLSRRYEGIGLGLPLTRKLVELHRGQLWIDSRLGQGTVVTVSFPGRIVVDAAPAEELQAAAQREPEHSPAKRQANRRRAKSAPGSTARRPVKPPPKAPLANTR